MEFRADYRAEYPADYRDDLSAALLKIERLEEELALFHGDPSYERVEVAEEALARARARRRWLQKILPRVCIAAFVAMGAFALTHPALPEVVHLFAYAIVAAGLATAVVTIVWMLVYAAQGDRPKRILELERNVRLAKGDAGRRLRVELANDRSSQPLARLPAAADDASPADPHARAAAI